MTINKHTFILAALGLFTLGLCVGMLAAHLVFDKVDDTPPVLSPIRAINSSPERGAADSGELAQALRDLRIVLASLEGTIANSNARPDRAPSNPRTDVINTAMNESSTDLAFQKIATALERLSVKSGGPSSNVSPESLVSPAWVDRKTAFSFIDVERLLGDDEFYYDIAVAELVKRHLFWSLQDVLTRFGKPDQIEVDGSVIYWSYYKAHEVEGVGHTDVRFYFSDGLVYSGDIDYEGY